MTRPMKGGREHNTVVVRHGKMVADIDEAIAALVVETWKAGVSTDSSCQDARDPGDAEPWVFLDFSSVGDARRWMAIVAAHRKDGRWLHNQAMRQACRDMRMRGAACWRWDTSAYDAVYTVVGATKLDFLVGVRFPRSDLAIVLRRLRAANRAGARQTGGSP